MFKTWLISNLGIAYVVCAIILWGLSAIFIPVDYWLFSLIPIGVISFVIFMAEDKTIGPVLIVFLLAGLYIYLIYKLRHPEDGTVFTVEDMKVLRNMNTFVISLSVICSVPAFFIARYANINFDDVVSRRWMYRNSAKDVFESTWKYTFNRFFMGFLVVFSLLLDLAVIIFIAIMVHSGAFDSLPQ